MYRNIFRGINTNTHLVSFDAKYCDDDIITYNEGFTHTSC